jgi:hypothetical protein
MVVVTRWEPVEIRDDDEIWHQYRREHDKSDAECLQRSRAVGDTVPDELISSIHQTVNYVHVLRHW